MLDRHVDHGGVHPECELLDWRGPQLPDHGLPDTTPVRELRNYGGGKCFMVVPLGQRFLKVYSRVPRSKANPTRVTSWKLFDKFLENSFELV